MTKLSSHLETSLHSVPFPLGHLKELQVCHDRACFLTIAVSLADGFWVHRNCLIFMLFVVWFLYAETFCPEEELQRLVCRAMKQNPNSQYLKDALIKQSWDGTVTLIFCCLGWASQGNPLQYFSRFWYHSGLRNLTWQMGTLQFK